MPPRSLSSTALKSLFHHKSWANAQLFELLASLPPGNSQQLDVCLRTLNHVYIVDRIFRGHLSGGPRPYDTTNTAETPSLDWLKCEVRETDAWYESYVQGAVPGVLSETVDFTFTSGNPGRMSREEILLHVATHGVYHRGGVAQVLKSISVTPPDDPYTVFLHETEPDRKHA